MTEARKLTLKEWKRRALQAEQRVEFLQQIRATESVNELKQISELSALRVALKEAQEVIAWALEQQT